MLRDYLTSYPNETGDTGKTALLQSILPFMNGSVKIPVISSEDVSTFHRVTHDARLSRSSANFSASEQFTSLSSSKAQVAEVRNVNTATRPLTEERPLVSGLNQNLPIQNLIPVDPAAIAQPKAEQKPHSAETIRNKINQNEDESSGISSEIAALRRTLQKEREKNEKGVPSEFASVNSRIASLERSLEQKRAETRELEARLARVTDNSRGTTSEEPTDSGPRKRTVASSQVALPASVQNPISSAPISAPSMGSGATLGGSNGGRSSSISPSRSSAPATSLEKFGVQASSQQGVITVASPSSTIDYNQLRTQSGDNFLLLSVKPEEFNQIANNDQSVFSRYLDQLKSIPGEVVRVNVSVPGEDRSIELFVVKNGDQISLVPGQAVGRAIASEREEVPEKTVDREITLKDLRNELTQ
jgi:hypothetical protein